MESFQDGYGSASRAGFNCSYGHILDGKEVFGSEWFDDFAPETGLLCRELSFQLGCLVNKRIGLLITTNDFPASFCTHRMILSSSILVPIEMF